MMTLAALVCFAANSLLCRYALGEGWIDAATFTTVRLGAGALTLGLLTRPSGRPGVVSALALFAYATLFSFAYKHVTAATGALLLFGAVQVTMLVGAMLLGERVSRLQWAGLVVAVAGVSYLLFPGLESPPLVGASLMLTSGVAWGIYSLRGQSGSVAHHFLLAVPLAALSNLAFMSEVHVTGAGFLAAVVSGAVTSGIGYAIWFRALKTLSSTVAATVQLSVPVLAALGGACFLSEPVTTRLVIASIAILAGIALTLPVTRSWRVQWCDVVAAHLLRDPHLSTPTSPKSSTRSTPSTSS